MSSVKASPLRLAIAARGRMPPADKASDNRSPCVIVKLLCVTICRIHGRPPARGFLPPVFSGSFRPPSFRGCLACWRLGKRKRHPRQPWGKTTPRLKSAPIRGVRLQQGKGLPCFGRLLASPLLAVCLPVFWVLGCCCRCGSVRWCGCCLARECARQ